MSRRNGKRCRDSEVSSEGLVYWVVNEQSELALSEGQLCGYPVHISRFFEASRSVARYGHGGAGECGFLETCRTRKSVGAARSRMTSREPLPEMASPFANFFLLFHRVKGSCTIETCSRSPLALCALYTDAAGLFAFTLARSRRPPTLVLLPPTLLTLSFNHSLPKLPLRSAT